MYLFLSFPYKKQFSNFTNENNTKICQLKEE